MNLVFNDDGTLSPDQLAGLPEDLAQTVTSPEFIQNAKREIQKRRFLESARAVRELAQRNHEARRPENVSGRQRKRLRRLARKMISATIQENQGENLNG